MPNRYRLYGERVLVVVKRAGARYGIKAGIIAAGVAVAAGTLHRTTYLSRQPLVQRVAAAAPSAAAESATVAARVTSGGFDAGLDHERVQRWIERLTGQDARYVASVLYRKTKYDDMIEAKLEERGMPRDLVYLAMIESDFNPVARSRVQAVGLWQFMSGTARRFGLTVGHGVDERKDPARATDAALAYLSKLHDRFGSWYLAAAAYNSGEGTVLKALQRVLGRTTGTDEDFFRIADALPKETREYVPKLIATAEVGNAPEKYGIPVRDAADTAVATPAGPVPVATVAQVADAPVSAPKRHARAVKVVQHRVSKAKPARHASKRTPERSHAHPSAKHGKAATTHTTHGKRRRR